MISQSIVQVGALYGAAHFLALYLIFIKFFVEHYKHPFSEKFSNPCTSIFYFSGRLEYRDGFIKTKKYCISSYFTIWVFLFLSTNCVCVDGKVSWLLEHYLEHQLTQKDFMHKTNFKCIRGVFI